MVLIMPNIINTIKKASNNQNTYTASMIYSAMDTYIANNDFFNEESGKTYCVTINKLVNLGLLQSPINYNNEENIEETMSVRATYNNKWNYTILTNAECTTNRDIICSKTNASTVTYGLIPEDKYEVGDEYICNLGVNTTYHFFILNTNGDKANLIAQNNLGTNGSLTNSSTNSKWYSNADNTYGPIDAYTYLSTNTSSWVNIYPIKNFNFIDGNKDADFYGYNGIFVRKDGINYLTSINNNNGNRETFTNIRARMPILNEIKSIGCTESNGSCPSWLEGGFYLNDSYDSSSTSAYYVSSNKAIISTTVNTDAGIRPVIELYKSDLE